MLTWLIDVTEVQRFGHFCKSCSKCYLGTGANAFSSAGSSSGLVYDDGNHPFL